MSAVLLAEAVNNEIETRWQTTTKSAWDTFADGVKAAAWEQNRL